MSVRYLDLVDYLAIAAEITGLDDDSASRVARLHLADSALHAPAGNKRAAWVALRTFLELNRWGWVDYPSVDEAEHAMIAVASGEWDEGRMAAWLRPRLGSPEP